MARELLSENYENLEKADIFSLGISVHELASCEPLPKNGERWQELRSGNAGKLEGYSLELNRLIELMLSTDPADRPTAREILKHPALNRFGNKKVKRTKSWIVHELEKVERKRNELLQ
jgi:wee1-like protein kinase